MNDVERLLAKQEIYEVLTRYCRGIDRLDRPLVRSCYHDDAVDNHGLYNGTVEFFLDNAFRRQKTLVSATHCIHNVLIDFDPADDRAAFCEAYGNAVERQRLDNGSLIDNLVGFRYVDRFERRDEAWLIATRTVVIDWSRSEAVDADWMAGRDVPRGTRDRSDPVYALAQSE